VFFLAGSVHFAYSPDILWIGLYRERWRRSASTILGGAAVRRRRLAVAVVALCRRPSAGLFRSSNDVLLLSLLSGLLLVAAAWELRHYFIAPSAAQTFSDLHVGTAARAAEALDEEEEGHAAFFFIVPGMRLTQDESVRFLAPTLTAQDVPDTDDWQVTFDASREYSLFFLPGREDDLAAIRGCLPQGEISQVEGWGGELLFQRYRVHPDQSVVCGAHAAGTADGDASWRPGLSE
jgi:hypothetical protein